MLNKLASYMSWRINVVMMCHVTILARFHSTSIYHFINSYININNIAINFAEVTSTLHMTYVHNILITSATCNMRLKCGGVEGGWMQVVDVDMNRDNSCPGTWRKIITPRRLCLGYVAGCASAYFYVKGVSYEHICGQVKGYQKGHTNAYQIKLQSIDQAYVDGISIIVTVHVPLILVPILQPL